MKPVKLLLKNCMNIGNEDAAGNSAFIFSLIESCKLNDIAPQDYLKHLFERILHGKDRDKKVLLSCFINRNVKIKMAGNKMITNNYKLETFFSIYLFLTYQYIFIYD